MSRAVLRHGLGLALAGIALGLAGAFAMNRLLSSLLYEVSATDPVTLTAVSILLLATSLGACYVPARRAARVGPLRALTGH